MRMHLFRKSSLIFLYLLGVAIVSVVAIGIASGYRLNYSSWRIYKVSIVHLVCDPIAKLEVNGQKTKLSTPSALYLEPGNYNIFLSKEGYNGVNLDVSLNSGSLYEIKDLTLFKSGISPNIQPTTGANISDFIDTSLTNQNSDLFIAYDHEIWASGHLVTRLSSPIKSVAFYTNRSYIIYQTDSFVGVVRTNGNGNQKLFSYSSPYQLHFSFKNRGQVLLANDFSNSITATIN